MIKASLSSKIRIVRVDDWAGLYIDGILIKEDHSITEDTYEAIISSLGVDIEIMYREDLDLGLFGHGFPPRFEQIPDPLNRGEIIEKMRKFFTDPVIDQFLSTKHKKLRNRTPNDAIADGDGYMVVRIIDEFQL